MFQIVFMKGGKKAQIILSFIQYTYVIKKYGRFSHIFELIPVFGSNHCVITFSFCVFNLTIAISFNRTRDNQCIVNNKSIKLDALTLLILIRRNLYTWHYNNTF